MLRNLKFRKKFTYLLPCGDPNPVEADYSATSCYRGQIADAVKVISAQGLCFIHSTCQIKAALLAVVRLVVPEGLLQPIRESSAFVIASKLLQFSSIWNSAAHATLRCIEADNASLNTHFLQNKVC